MGRVVNKTQEDSWGPELNCWRLISYFMPVLSRTGDLMTFRLRNRHQDSDNFESTFKGTQVELELKVTGNNHKQVYINWVYKSEGKGRRQYTNPGVGQWYVGFFVLFLKSEMGNVAYEPPVKYCTCVEVEGSLGIFESSLIGRNVCCHRRPLCTGYHNYCRHQAQQFFKGTTAACRHGAPPKLGPAQRGHKWR